MTGRDERPGAGVFATVGLAAAAVFCCAGPLLLGAGGLSVIGGALRSPWLLFLGGALVLAAVGWSLNRRRRGCADCSDAGCGTGAPVDEPDGRWRNVGDDRTGTGEW